jgi:LCP family protein required for cell wall assembly
MTKRIVAVALAMSAWVAGTLAGSFGAAPAAGATFLQVGRAHEEADYAPSVEGDEPIFVLLLGSDARPGTPVDHGLADSIHILGINPGATRATLYGLPRDSYVPLASGGTGKINAAMPPGGLEAEIATVENLTGITFDYYALTGFDGFRSAIKDIDGLTVNLPYAVSGLDRSYPEGESTLNSEDALRLARIRKTVPRGDFDRSLHQGLIMISALAQFRQEYGKDAGALFTWLGAGYRGVQFDVPLPELTRLAELAMSIKPNRVTNLVALGSVGSAGGLSIVNLSSDNERLFRDLAEDGYIMPKAVPDAAQIQA